MTSRAARTMRVTAVALAASITLGGLGVAGAHADDPDAQKKKLDQSIQQTKVDLDMVSASLVKAAANLKQTDAAVKAAQSTLAIKKTELTAAQNHAKDVAAQLQMAQASEAKSTADLAANAAAQQKTHALVSDIARQSYLTGGLGNFELTLNLLSSRSDASEQMSVADIVMSQQNSVLNQLSSQQAAQASENQRLVAVRSRITTLKKQADESVAAADAAKDAATKAAADVEAQQKKQGEAKKSLEAQQKADQQQLAQQQADAAKLAQLLQKRALERAAAARRAAASATQAPAAAPPSGSTTFLTPPAPVSAIVSGFGMRLNPVDGVLRLHAGVDFPFACGTPVYAAAAGDVVQTYVDSAGGNMVVVDHGFVKGVNLASAYEHLTKWTVTPGQHVNKGQLVGISGSTGRSTGCHLHFATFENGVYVNPLRWIS